MQHLGDIKKINGGSSPPVDCVIGGSPCQNLSIAGNRKGLAGSESCLFLEQIRIVKEMRDASGNKYPRYMVWENVPGAYSSNKGRDFQQVLTEIARIAEPEAPDVPLPEKGYPTWGVLHDVDGRWSIAWRTLDAQYWGVPQRRRRISLVADFGGDSAREILFESESLSGDFNEICEEREGVARGIGDSLESTNSRAISKNNTCYCIQGNAIDRSENSGCCGKGVTENVCYTPNTTDRHTVCAGFKLGNSEKARSIGYQVECSPTLNAQCGGNKPAILDMTHACDVIRECGDVVPTLNARMGTGGNQVPLTYAFGRSDTYAESDVASTESARQYKSATDNICGSDKSIRRLTPLECERLQGYPDGWTDIGDYIDSGGRKRKTSDSARYKALGNSIAIPPWRWVLNRICSHLGDKPTMGSLFDGIGGFPLIWEEICGKGTCLWASEIEEFPMAVTNKRFNM